MRGKLGRGGRMVLGMVLAGLLTVSAGRASEPEASVTPLGSLAPFSAELPSLDRPLTGWTYLPAGPQATEPLPTVFLLHGHGGDGKAWDRDLHLRARVGLATHSGELPRALYVMPDGGKTWYTDRPEKVGTAIGGELPGWLAERYPAATSRENRFLMGLSMGGYGAVRLMLLFPENFSAFVGQSPAVYSPEPPRASASRKVEAFGQPYDSELWKAQNYTAFLADSRAAELGMRGLIYTGDDDHLEITHHSVLCLDRLRAAGIPTEFRVIDGGHEGKVWRTGMVPCLRFLLRGSE